MCPCVGKESLCYYAYDVMTSNLQKKHNYINCTSFKSDSTSKIQNVQFLARVIVLKIVSVFCSPDVQKY